MWGPIINAVFIIVCSVIGLLVGKKLKENIYEGVMTALYLGVIAMGVINAIKTEDLMCMSFCVVLGTAIGEFAKLQDRIDGAGEWLRSRVDKSGKSGRFTEGFVTATIVFCVGSVGIMSSIDVGIRGDYSLLLYKAVTDGVSSIMFAASMGIGVMFSALSVFVYQGTLTALASYLQPILTTTVINEMSAVGGVLLIGMGLSMITQHKTRPIKTANMVPAIFLPIAYVPIASWVAGLF